jgi:tyramine---L-glutamate ligase
MTTVFVYEDVTATGAGAGHHPSPAPSLLAEGRAMFEAVVADFAAVPGVRVVGPGESGASAAGGLASTPVAQASGSPEFSKWAGRSDFTLVVAPETGGRLEHLCREVERVGGRLLGPSPEAVRLAADKLVLARHWEHCGVPTPATWELGTEPPGRPRVVKPRDGAGSQATWHFAGTDRSPVSAPGPMIAQEYVSGFAASVAFLIGPAQTVSLLPCRQILSMDGRFQYLGGQLPIAPELATRTLRIAAAAVRCVPGLLGFIGLDVVLGDDGHDRAIEINPRLTTSYVGLRALARFNLAAAMLSVVRGEPVPVPAWHPGSIEFTPAGEMQIDTA